MPRRANPATVRTWKDRVKRCEKSQQSVAEFCRSEGVSSQAYYHWRQRLRGTLAGAKMVQPPRRAAGQSARTSRFRSVLVVPAEDRRAPVTIRLPHGSVIELESQLPMIEQVVGQLLSYERTRGGDGC